MKTSRVILASAGLVAFGSALLVAAPRLPIVPTWTQPGAAAAARPGFEVQGEYRGTLDGEPAGLRVADIGEAGFHVLTYPGGLPGDGWDGSKPAAERLDHEALERRLEGWKRAGRKSPTLGESPAEGAIVVFDGEKTEHVEGEIRDGLLWAGSRSTTPVGDFRLHLEFRLPYKPDRPLGSQDRGNSGVYLFNNYEIQVLDDFGLDFDVENNAVDAGSDSSRWCGCLYEMKRPDVPMAFPPLRWQTYDIEFTAPRFEGGEKVENARVTVRHNGVLIHDDVELTGGTGGGGRRPEKAEGTVHLQGHGNPVAYRNVWLVESSGE